MNKNNENLKQAILILFLTNPNKIFSPSEIANELDITTQKAAALLHSLVLEDKIKKLYSNNKIKYSIYANPIKNYPFYADYPYIVVASKTMVVQKGFYNLNKAILWANLLAIVNQHEFIVVDNR